jgi:hypothetical protein
MKASLKLRREILTKESRLPVNPEIDTARTLDASSFLAEASLFDEDKLVQAEFDTGTSQEQERRKRALIDFAYKHKIRQKELKGKKR